MGNTFLLFYSPQASEPSMNFNNYTENGLFRFRVGLLFRRGLRS